MAYALHHPSTPRTLAYSHTLALFILGWYLLLGIIARSAPLMLKGYLISYAIARVGHVLTNGWTGAGPFLGLGIHSTSCLWSSSLFTHPITCGKLEYETLLDNVRYLLSRGKTNCMTRDLYQSRGLFAMALARDWLSIEAVQCFSLACCKAIGGTKWWAGRNILYTFGAVGQRG